VPPPVLGRAALAVARPSTSTGGGIDNGNRLG